MRLFEKLMRIRKAVVFKFKDGRYGHCYPDDNTEPIVINLTYHKRGDVVRTYAHELIHLLYPKASEKRVRQLESLLWARLTSKQKFLLARKLYNRRWRTK